MKKNLLISTIVAGLILGSTALYAGEKTAKETISHSIKVSVEKEKKKQKENFTAAPKEIVDGFNATVDAIEFLDKNDVQHAKKALRSASKNFDTALKASPELDLVPFAQEVVVHEFLGNAKTVKKSLVLVGTLIDDYDTQVARTVMAPLEDEMIVTTQAIPMKLYPLATKNALEALEKGKKDEAIELLDVSLNTIVTETVLMPLPLLVAEDLVYAAADVDKENKTDALKLLTLAQDELQKGIYLGYTKKHAPEYKAIDESIEAIKKEIKGKNAVEKLYDKLKESFGSLVDKSREKSSKHTSSKQ